MSAAGQEQSFASVSYEVGWPLQGEVMSNDTYLDRHALLKRAVTGALYVLAFVAASAYWLLPLRYFLLAALALAVIYAIAGWAGVDLRLWRSASSE